MAGLPWSALPALLVSVIAVFTIDLCGEYTKVETNLDLYSDRFAGCTA
jgi:hypothetical protein